MSTFSNPYLWEVFREHLEKYSSKETACSTLQLGKKCTVFTKTITLSATVQVHFLRAQHFSNILKELCITQEIRSWRRSLLENWAKVSGRSCYLPYRRFQPELVFARCTYGFLRCALRTRRFTRKLLLCHACRYVRFEPFRSSRSGKRDFKATLFTT